jgi:hypothetical protein
MYGNRILRSVGLGIAAATVLVTGAQAAERPDDRAGMIGVGAAQVVEATPDAFERAVLRHASTAPPDAFERAIARQSTVALRPDDRAGARGPGAVAPTLSASADPTEPGFGWNDALLRAAGILGVLLLGAAATLTIRHRGRVVLR